MTSRLPIVAIVGRPNVGKFDPVSTGWSVAGWRWSTIVRRHPAIVAKAMPSWSACHSGSSTPPASRMRIRKACRAGCARRWRQRSPVPMSRCFLVDARAGITPLDEELARWLRTAKLPVVVVANKAEAAPPKSGVLEAFALGLRRPGRAVGRTWRRHGRPVRRLAALYPPRRAGGGDRRDRRTRRAAQSWRSSAGRMPASRR